MAENDDAQRDLIATLQACSERLNIVQKEAGLAGALLEMAVTSLRRSADSASLDERLGALLTSHHDRLVDSVVEKLRAFEARPDQHHAFRMDPAGRSARIGRRRIPLTESEYKVLERLWEQMPSPVSRAALLEHLYGPDHDHTETVIDMFILRIRQKLKNAGCTDAAIVALRGLGWVLDLGPAADSERLNGEEQTIARDQGPH